MELKFIKRFVKSYKKSDIFTKRNVDKAIQIFMQDPFHISLHNHPLKGDMQGYRTINATGDYRIIFKELSNGGYEIVELIDIGTHSQLYG